MSTATDVDGELFARELDSFLPERIFDTHTHRWRQEFINSSVDGTAVDMGLAEYGSACRISTGAADLGTLHSLRDGREPRQVAGRQRVGIGTDCRGFHLWGPVLCATGG